MATGYTPSGLSLNQPSVISAPNSYNILSAQTLASFSILKPDVASEFVRRFGRQNDLITMFERLNFKKRITNSTIFRHYEEDRLHTPVILANTSGGAAGAAVVVNVAAADVFEVTQAAPYIGNAKQDIILPVVGDTGHFENNVECQVLAVDASGPTFTVAPVDSTESVPTIVDGDKFIITSNAAVEFNKPRTSRSSRVIYFQNQTQIFRTDYKSSETAGSEQVWVEFEGGNRWYYLDLPNTHKRHKDNIAMGLLFGKEITNAVINQTPGFEELKKTRGLVPIIEASGIEESYTAGEMELADWRTHNSTLMEQAASNNRLLMCSQDFRDDINTLVREGDGMDKGGFNQDSRASIIFREFNGGVQAVDFDVDVFKFGGFTYNVQVNRAFSDPTQLGAISKYKNFCVELPMDEVSIYEELGGSPVSVPSHQVVYKSSRKGGDREIIDVYRDIEQTGEDSWEHHMITECGLQTNAINHSAVWVGEESN